MESYGIYMLAFLSLTGTFGIVSLLFALSVAKTYFTVNCKEKIETLKKINKDA